MSSPTQPAPKPDPATGEPRPPQAPVDPGWRPFEKAKDYGPDDPPPGKGPALEWFADTRSMMWKTTAFVFVLFVAFVTWYWGGFGWMKVWWLWLIVVGSSSLFLLARRGGRATAGADWLKSGGKQCVDTYRLRIIRVTTGRGADRLELVDTDGGQLDTRADELQKNRRLWDLVYNGILHSIAYTGADVNRKAVEHLYLQGVIRKPPVDR